jgi:hypothetical protein
MDVAELTIALFASKWICYTTAILMGAIGRAGRDLSRLVSSANMRGAPCEAQRCDLIELQVIW